MERLALAIVVVLALLYVVALVVFSIALLPLGVLPLLFLLAMGLYCYRAFVDKRDNAEDKRYQTARKTPYFECGDISAWPTVISQGAAVARPIA